MSDWAQAYTREECNSNTQTIDHHPQLLDLIWDPMATAYVEAGGSTGLCGDALGSVPPPMLVTALFQQVVHETFKCRTGKWLCRGCDRAFTRADRARQHEALESGITRYPCLGGIGHVRCGRSFASPELARAHSDRGTVTCNNCGKTLQKRNIARHKKNHIKA